MCSERQKQTLLSQVVLTAAEKRNALLAKRTPLSTESLLHSKGNLLTNLGYLLGVMDSAKTVE